MLKFKDQRLLVIAPHPDDEVLGCGGLIKKIRDGGGRVYVLFMTVGTTTDYSQAGISTAQERLVEIEEVAKFLNYNDYRVAFPDDNHHLRLDQIPQKELIFEIEEGGKISLNKIKPTIVATPQPYDYNQDHRAVAQAIFSATRPTPPRFKHRQTIVLGYEFSATAQWSLSSPNNPNFFIKLKRSDLTAKVQALKLYRSQLRNGYHSRSPRSLRSLAYARGAQCGVEAAEAFFSFRVIV